MKHVLRFALASIILQQTFVPEAASAESGSAFSHDLLDTVLRKYVDAQGQVDYAGIARDRQDLDAYVDSIARVSLDSHPHRFETRLHELAYWINAYNGLVLHSVVDAYPITSVADLGGLDGFFQIRPHILGGDSLSLDRVENEIIRTRYGDARIHFAGNCGAVSCPALDRRAYVGKDLIDHLERQTRRFAADDQHLEWRSPTLHVSKLLEWYRQDFTGPDRSDPQLIAFLRRYVPEDLAPVLEQVQHIQFFDYDWALNDQALQKAGAGRNGAPER
ncbi:MAG: DUF547 domain-containing protein [Candidatus Latescibacteria bacterium]|nr:DUF547 domain-containing protein [Candidatus Latescibacterota bacterium]MDP7635882.1 DUF547 domain-containing protein [Candidatus Latescibacterota bacterium]